MRFRSGINFAGLAAVLFCLLPQISSHSEEVINLGPLLYIDRDEETGTKTVDALGPFVSYKKTPDTTEYGFRPVFYDVENEARDRSSFDFLYPLFTHRNFEGDTKLQLLVYLFYYKSDLRPSGFREYEYTLIPLIFGRKDEQPEKSYFAFFPFFGTLKHKYGKDEISFALFPLYLRTKDEGMTNQNFVWPFFGAYSGEGVSGGRFWPIYGIREKGDEFRDEFALWPIYMRRDKEFYGEQIKSTAFMPFYYSIESPSRTQKTYLWPFINIIDNPAKDYKRWDIPWPFVTISRGTIHTNRIFPLYAQRTEKNYETGSFLWPMYWYRMYRFSDYDRKKTVGGLFFVKSTTDTPTKEGGKSGKSVHLWPIFSYYTAPDGTSRFHFLSILETFLGDNPPRERNWSPFWQIAVWRMDAEGNQMSSILWNTIRTERTETSMKFELRPIIPVISFEKSEERSKFYLLGGLLGFKSEDGRNIMKLLYVPIPLWRSGGDGSETASEGGFGGPVFRPGFSGALGEGNVFTGYFLRDKAREFEEIYNNEYDDKPIKAAMEGSVDGGGS
ncbi:MAG: hypothetical protein KJ002_01945 [Candidatus Dadabacteria bacterium]|nr:hypothetical protein [Candidatus Dadabacteria bacterium]